MQGLDFASTPQVFKTPQHLLSESLSQAWLAWRDLAGDRFAPSRRQINPSQFKPVLGQVFLVDVIDGGADFRFALGGDMLVRFLKHRVSAGMLLSTVSGSSFHERVLRILRRCIETRQPVAVGPSPTTLEGREYLELEALVLPLSDDGRSVTSLVGAVHTSVAAHYLGRDQS